MIEMNWRMKEMLSSIADKELSSGVYQELLEDLDRGWLLDDNGCSLIGAHRLPVLSSHLASSRDRAGHEAECNTFKDYTEFTLSSGRTRFEVACMAVHRATLVAVLGLNTLPPERREGAVYVYAQVLFPGHENMNHEDFGFQSPWTRFQTTGPGYDDRLDASSTVTQGPYMHLTFSDLKPNLPIEELRSGVARLDQVLKL